MNKTHSDIEIKYAKLEHISEMLAICTQNLIAAETHPVENELKKTGFLIYELTEEEIKNAILNKQKHIVLIAIKNGHVLAYALGRNVMELAPSLLSDIIASSEEVERIIHSEKVFFYIQVAKMPGVPHVGLEISKAMFNEMKQQGYQYNLAVIVHHPLANTKSIHFHQQFGFQCVGTITMNNYTLGVYLTRL